MKVSDYIIQFFVDKGITTAFGISGGAILHVFDSAHHHGKLKVVYAAHEQGACAMADGYARISKLPGLVFSTSGPGITNCLTSICNVWYDSIPLVVIAGQVASNRLMSESDKAKGMRAKGFQELPTVDIFKKVTKYCVEITHKEQVKECLEKAWELATEGRPGPVILSICDDVSRQNIEV